MAILKILITNSLIFCCAHCYTNEMINYVGSFGAMHEGAKEKK